LIQDGRRTGHVGWATDAIQAGIASGVIISPFHTPKIAAPRQPAGLTVARAVQDVGGEAILDATTHGLLLPGTNDYSRYETWPLWGPAGVGLDTDIRRLEHLERVFAHQAELGTPALAPTITLDNALGQDAHDALRTAEIARGMQPACWQSIAGRRSFWRSGADLDAHIGQLASLRAPCWVMTIVNDQVVDNITDMADTEAFSGVLRTVHSLSQRGRVILCHADLAGLPAVAAGASDLGAGWDRGMRFFDPKSFQTSNPGIQIPASYVTQGGLGAVLRRDAGDAIARILGEPDATRLRGGPMPPDDAAERIHHLRQLSQLLAMVHRHGGARQPRVAELRRFYETGIAWFDHLLGRLPKTTLQENSRQRWLDQPLAALHSYASAEGLWI
jgi:hypothetical protein